jgi:hypothetical protein
LEGGQRLVTSYFRILANSGAIVYGKIFIKELDRELTRLKCESKLPRCQGRSGGVPRTPKRLAETLGLSRRATEPNLGMANWHGTSARGDTRPTKYLSRLTSAATGIKQPTSQCALMCAQ